MGEIWKRGGIWYLLASLGSHENQYEKNWISLDKDTWHCGKGRRIENLCYAGNFGKKIIGNSKKSENLPESEKEV